MNYEIGDRVLLYEDVRVYEIIDIFLDDCFDDLGDLKFKLKSDDLPSPTFCYERNIVKKLSSKPRINTIHASGYFSTRPCIYKDKEARFHRWIDVENFILKFDRMLRNKVADEFMSKIKNKGYIPANIGDLVLIKGTYALIELEDGSVKKVEPEEIRFNDVSD